MDYPMIFEKLVRKIFQCSQYGDPLGRLANADFWSGLTDDEFIEERKCQAWAVLGRLKSEYLDSKTGRYELYKESNEIEFRILSARSNKEILELMMEINNIVNKLDLKEYPHLAYDSSNDQNRI